MMFRHPFLGSTSTCTRPEPILEDDSIDPLDTSLQPGTPPQTQTFQSDQPIPIPGPIPNAPSTSWNGSPLSWSTSKTTAYDINSVYTTANARTTHRRRRSSILTSLIARSSGQDPYQPTYKDWRDRPTESPPGSFSLDSGVNVAGEGILARWFPRWSVGNLGGIKGKSARTVKVKMLVVVFVFVILGLFGWKGGHVFEGSVESIASFGDRCKALRPDWTLDRTWSLSFDGNWQDLLPSWFTEHVEKPSKSGTIGSHAMSTSASTSTSTFYLNPDLLWATAGTVTRVTRPVLGSPMSSKASVMTMTEMTEEVVSEREPRQTALGRPRSVGYEDHTESEGKVELAAKPTGTRADGGSNMSEEVTSEGDDSEERAHRSRVSELWRKHARILPIENIRTDKVNGGRKT